MAASLSPPSAAAAGRVRRCHADVTASAVRRLLRYVSRHVLNRRHVHATDAAHPLRQQVSRPHPPVNQIKPNQIK